VRYAFVAAHRREFRLTAMCRALRMHRSGFYAWTRTPQSRRAIEDERILKKIRTSYQASDGVYGSPRVHRDIREDGERCGEHRVARLMRINGLRAIRGYKKPRYRAGKPALVAPNRLEQNFSVVAPDRVWATDITYIRTFEGWLYLAVVVDLYSRIVVGWSMKSALTRELVLDALLMAIWRRRPTQPVIVHSDQGSQYGSDDAVRFCKDHGLIPSMSRRGNCFDNAVAESFFSSLKKERIRRRIYRSREEARADVFDYIEVFYNRIRRHSHLGQMSPHDFEQAALTQA
jgi:putative transposase